MPDVKISQFNTLDTLNGQVLFPIVDTADTAMSSSGTNKKLFFSTLVHYLSSVVHPSPGPIGTANPDIGVFTGLTALEFTAEQITAVSVILENLYTFTLSAEDVASNNVNTNTLMLNPLQGFPSNPTAGTVYYSGAGQSIRVYNGSNWMALVSNLITLTPDMSSTVFTAPFGEFSIGDTVKYHITPVVDTYLHFDLNILKPTSLESVFELESSTTLFDVDVIPLFADQLTIIQLEYSRIGWLLTSIKGGYIATIPV